MTIYNSISWIMNGQNAMTSIVELGSLNLAARSGVVSVAVFMTDSVKIEADHSLTHDYE